MPFTAAQPRSLPCSESIQTSHACAPAGSPNTETVSFFLGQAASSASFSGFINETLGGISVAPIKPQLAYQCGQQYSITALTDSSGTIVERYAYSAYGIPTITNATGTLRSVSTYDNRYTYTGREWDDTLFMYHYRARMYDARLGRFLSRDPIGYLSGFNLLESKLGLYKLDPTGNIAIVAGAGAVLVAVVAVALVFAVSQSARNAYCGRKWAECETRSRRWTTTCIARKRFSGPDATSERSVCRVFHQTRGSVACLRAMRRCVTWRPFRFPLFGSCLPCNGEDGDDDDGPEPDDTDDPPVLREEREIPLGIAA